VRVLGVHNLANRREIMNHDGMSRGLLLIGGIVVGCCSVTNASPPVFTNQTGAANIAVSHSTSGFDQFTYSGGGAIGDFNNDGWQDFYLPSGGNSGRPDRLFINNQNGTFSDQAAAWGVNSVIHKGKGVSVADYNKDGWMDVYVTSAGPGAGPAQAGHHKLWRNNGNGTFSEVAAAAGVNFTHATAEDGWGSSWGDYDLDGDLDLVVGGFVQVNTGSKFFRNNGDGTFTNITAGIGLFSGVPHIFGFAPSLIDMNGDFYPDLPFVGDFGTSRYFRSNSNGTFTEMSNTSGTAEEENGMGNTFGDFNNDGKLDWYVTSIYFPGIGWTGNKIYRNNGGHSYTEYSVSAGVHDGGYGWGAAAIDFNHDGWTDIAETNGDDGTSGKFFNEQSYLFMNNGNDTFTEQAVSSGLIHNGKGRALLHFDYDNDGDQDLIIVANNEPLNFYRNDLNLAAADTHWLRVFLDSSGHASLPPNGCGARILIFEGAQKFYRQIAVYTSFLGTSELSAHFGLGTLTSVDSMMIEWPDGQTTEFFDVDTNQTLTIRPEGVFGDLDQDANVNLDDHDLFSDCLTGPGGGVLPGCDRADLDEDVDVDLDDFQAFMAAF
jgi:hypothetical protein